MKEITGIFSGLEGIRLFWKSFRPSHEKVKAAVILMHGGNNYCDMSAYRNLAQKLVKENFVVYTYDQRGFGRSEGLRMHMGKWANVRGDMAAFLHLVRAKEPNVKIFAVGMSFGALQTLDQAIVSPHLLDGIVLMSISTVAIDIPTYAHTLINVLGKVMPKIKLPAGVHESFHGAKAKMEKKDLWADPLCPAYMTVGNVRELMLRQNRIRKELKFLTIPVLHMQGGQDTVAFVDKTLLKRTSSRDRTYQYYPNATHDMLEEDSVGEDIVLWLNKRVST
ncbi:hypothetical protein FACS189418_6570 [Clostridia bacterium]|nr:hypothetical protein FACS189418_6570 [Clostridia bacterium]